MKPQLILWPPESKSWLIEKDSAAGKDWKQKGKEVAEEVEPEEGGPGKVQTVS